MLLKGPLLRLAAYPLRMTILATVRAVGVPLWIVVIIAIIQLIAIIESIKDYSDYCNQPI